MIFTTAILAALCSFSVSASPTPLQKRFTGATIKSYRTGSCLTLQGGVQIQNGSPLKVGDCATATKWDINPGSGSVIVHGTNYALDAGTDPHNNVPAKVWQSYPTLTQQTWYLTPDNRIAITGGNQCLDEGENGPQTYQCTTGNTNQIWYVDGGSTPTSSSMAPGSTPTGPTGPVAHIKWKTDQTLCATVQGTPADGTAVALASCDNSNPLQKFYTFDNGPIQLVGTNYCFDAGIDPKDATTMKIWTCYKGLSQQTWQYPNGTQEIVTANNECLDLDNETKTRLQTFNCGSSNPQQQWVVG